MPIQLQIQEQFRSVRIKSIELHPENPWILSGLFDGSVTIWDYRANAFFRSFEVCTSVPSTSKNPTVPVRSARFIPRMHWIVCGSDDNTIRVINHDTRELVKEWVAHGDYIRSIDVHTSRSLILSTSDDKSIRLWDWDQDFACIGTFDGHTHYVMSAKFDPMQTNSFVSVALDASIKFWDFDQSSPISTINNAHAKGINCLDIYQHDGNTFLLSGGDDFVVKVWDMVSKECIQTLSGHEGNISSVCFLRGSKHISSSSEDGTVRMWSSDMYLPVEPIDVGLERPWSMQSIPQSNSLAVGYDFGSVIISVDPLSEEDTESIVETQALAATSSAVEQFVTIAV